MYILIRFSVSLERTIYSQITDSHLVQMQEAPLNLNLDCAALPNLEEAPAHLAEAISIGPLLSVCCNTCFLVKSC